MVCTLYVAPEDEQCNVFVFRDAFAKHIVDSPLLIAIFHVMLLKQITVRYLHNSFLNIVYRKLCFYRRSNILSNVQIEFLAILNSKI